MSARLVTVAATIGWLEQWPSEGFVYCEGNSLCVQKPKDSALTLSKADRKMLTDMGIQFDDDAATT